jgi:hypothetical protein
VHGYRQWVTVAMFMIQRALVPRRARAATMVEFALVLMAAVLPMTIGTLEGSRWVATRFALANAAAEGARAGAFVPTSAWPLSTIDARIRQVAEHTVPQWMRITDGTIAICRRRATDTTPCSSPGVSPVQSGDVLEVTITYHYQWMPGVGFPGMTTNDMTVFHSVRID